ncbi:MAG: DUF1579 domain-containing protein [Phycisphaerales bacterium]|nr:DUF1579 domain-containing protein [Phycisphaerales bacterium]
MFCKSSVTTLCLAAVAAVGIAAGFGQPGNKDHKSPTPSAPAAGGHGQPGDMKLPPGWTPEDMKACMDAGTPGEMHAWLAKSVGTWKGKETMWMGPGADPISTECTSTITSLMDGRYFKCDMVGNIPDMGPFHGMAINGFDNVSKKFVASWVDSMSTGIMNGTGELSSDKKTLTWNYTFNCPIAKKPMGMREVDTVTGPDSMTMEMFTTDPKSGKEYKMLHIDFTRQK